MTLYKCLPQEFSQLKDEIKLVALPHPCEHRLEGGEFGEEAVKVKGWG
jgi:hypothetical protein